jgi:hypothetical protein
MPRHSTPRIDRTVVSGYFQSRQEVWKEPIYRDLWGLLHEHGDAELMALIAPQPVDRGSQRCARQSMLLLPKRRTAKGQHRTEDWRPHCSIR